MKINLEVDCTPEEARRAMGLPDMTPLHDQYIAMLLEAMRTGIKPEMLEPMLRSWAPMGEAGMTLWRRMMEGSLGQGLGGPGARPGTKPDA